MGERIIALTGFPASGKTSVGKLLAAKYNWVWLDLDVEIQRQAGQSIAEIFEQEGEQGFREREHKALKDALKQGCNVVSLGGGTVLRDDNLALLKKDCKIVYLFATEEDLFKRVVEQESLTTKAVRPLLAVDKELNGVDADALRERLSVLVKQRAARYQEVADVVIDTSGLSLEQIADRVVEEVAKVSVY